MLDSTETDDPHRDSPDLSDVLTEAPSSTTDTKKGKEHRSERRFRVKWRATAVINGLGTFHGFIRDISTKGAAIFLDRNLHGARVATLHIQVPTIEAGGSPRIVEVEGKVVYSNHDSEELSFRSGILFTRFKTASDPAYLDGRLHNHHVEISDSSAS